MYESDKNNIDLLALHYLLKDAPDSYAPIKIVGDGNCFSRAVSLILFHTQNKQSEIWTCIVYEGLQNMGLYLNNTYLTKDATNFYHQGTLSDQYDMYSDNYNPERDFDVRAIYVKELLDIYKDGAYMAIWQLFQVANVLGNPFYSVYPDGGNVSISKDLNHKIFCKNDTANSKQPINLVWTLMQVGNGRPCHFVPLLKVVRRLRLTYQK